MDKRGKFTEGGARPLDPNAPRAKVGTVLHDEVIQSHTPKDLNEGFQTVQERAKEAGREQRQRDKEERESARKVVKKPSRLERMKRAILGGGQES